MKTTKSYCTKRFHIGAVASTTCIILLYGTERTCAADVWGSFFKCIITSSTRTPSHPIYAVTDLFLSLLGCVLISALTCLLSFSSALFITWSRLNWTFLWYCNKCEFNYEVVSIRVYFCLNLQQLTWHAQWFISTEVDINRTLRVLTRVSLRGASYGRVDPTQLNDRSQGYYYYRTKQLYVIVFYLRSY